MTESNSPTNDHFANPSPSHANSFVSPQTDSVTNTVFEDAINYFHDTSTAHQSPLRCCPQKVVPSVLSTTPDVSVASGRRLIFDQSGTGSSKKLRANAVHQIMNHNRKQSKKELGQGVEAKQCIMETISGLKPILEARRKKHVLQYGRKKEEELSQSAQEVDGTDTDLNKYRSLMGNLYGVAGVAHAVDSFFGPSALITASGAPPFLELPLIGKGFVALWCLAGPLAFVLARMGNAAADIGLILYGLIEVIGAYFLPENSAFVNAIAVQIVVFAAWQYSRVKSDKS